MTQPPASRPIFTRFPSLAQRATCVKLAELPTPTAPLGSGPGWIKRDDISHPLYGGNKIRKLEFLVGDWRAAGIDEVVTFGAIGTHAGLATSLVCQREKIACRVLLFDQPITDGVRANLRAMQQLGVRFEYHGSLASTYLWFSAHPRRLRAKSYFLFAGCANPPATLAYVNAALELKAQIDAGELPEPAEIVVPVGSSSTLAGLTLGCQIAGLRSRVAGVRVVPERLLGVDACSAATVRAQMRTAAATLGWTEPLPEPCLMGDFLGDGYGHATPAGMAATARFAALGVTLESTYSAKAAAYFWARQDVGNAPVLFWNTYNSRPLSGLPRAEKEFPLPRAVARRVA